MKHSKLPLTVLSLVCLSACGGPPTVAPTVVTRVQVVPSPVPAEPVTTFTLTSTQDVYSYITPGGHTIGRNSTFKWPVYIQSSNSQGRHTAELYIDLQECRYYAPDGVDIMVPVTCNAGDTVVGSTATLYAQWSSFSEPFSVTVTLEVP